MDNSEADKQEAVFIAKSIQRIQSAADFAERALELGTPEVFDTLNEANVTETGFRPGDLIFIVRRVNSHSRSGIGKALLIQMLKAQRENQE